MSVKPYQVIMEPKAHGRLKKRAKQLNITIGEMIENLLASFELRMKRAYDRIEANDSINISGLDGAEVDYTLMKLLLTKDKRDLTDKEFEDEQVRIFSSLRKDEWSPEIKFIGSSDYEEHFEKD